MVQLSYDGATLTETITDLDEQVSFTQTYNLDIAKFVDSLNQFYIGISVPESVFTEELLRKPRPRIMMEQTAWPHPSLD